VAVKRTFTALPDEIDYGKLRLPHWRALHIICRHYKLGHGPKGSMSQQLIAKLAGFSRETINAAIRDLKAWGLIEAVRDTTDKRSRRYLPVLAAADNDRDNDIKPNGIAVEDQRKPMWGGYSEAEVMAKAKRYSEDTDYTRHLLAKEDPGLIDFMRQQGLLPTLN